ncbi:MAG: phosphate ABC transporter substrate-binding protein PstS [Acidimicrobiales bacterium]
MNQPLHTSKRGSAWLVGLLAALTIATAACSSDSKTTTSSGSSSSSSASGAPAYDYASLSGTLNGSGSSFQDSFDQKAITDFKAVAPKVAVTYTKSGSGAGKTDLQGAVVQFAGTDSIIKDEDKAKYKGDVLYFPTVGAPITVAFNVSGVSKLQLSADVVAGIFGGTITTWNDQKIGADNAGVTLPPTPIVVVHRSDASGTTSNFTKFLKKAAPSVWTLDSGDTVNWPATTQGAEKNSGVASVVSGTNGAVGYVDLADAASAKLATAAIKNSAGKFVEGKLPGAAAALKGATVKDDLTYDPIGAAGDDAYPITSPTWIIAYAAQPDKATADALKGFLNFILTDGQKQANAVGYAPLPTDLATKAIAQLSKITGG